MKKIIYIQFILSCMLFTGNAANAQQKLWGIAHGESEYLFHINKDGTAITNVALPPLTVGTDPSKLYQASNGRIFGICNYGGDDSGTLFMISDGEIKKLYDFTYGAVNTATIVEGTGGYLYVLCQEYFTPYIIQFKLDGSLVKRSTFNLNKFDPSGGILFASNGLFYGVNRHGGINNKGFMYSVKPDLSGIDILYSFSKDEGQAPVGKLVEGADGYLYGCTYGGGDYRNGVIFKVSKDGHSYTRLHNFKNKSGRYPQGSLVLGNNGFLYGSTPNGGTNNQGVIFKIHTSGNNFQVIRNTTIEGSLLIDNETLFGYTLHHIFSMKIDGSDFLILKNLDPDYPTALLNIQQPLAPNVYITAPTNNTTNASVKGKYWAKEFIGATSYTLELSRMPDFNTIDFTATSSTNGFTIQDLTFNTKYYARVKVNVWPGFGKVTSFTTRQSLDYAYVNKPANGATEMDVINEGITANLVPYAKRYTIELNTQSNFLGTSIIRNSLFDYERTLNFEQLEYLTTYYVRVKTDLSPAFGKTTSFTTRAEVFSNLIGSNEGSTEVNPALLKLTVLPVPEAKRYTLELNTTSDFTEPSIIKESLNDNQHVFVFKNLQESTAYYARVKTDISSDYGDTKNFTTRNITGPFRLVGLTTAGGQYEKGTLFSFSTDSVSFTRHHDYQPVDYNDDNLNGSLTPIPDGGFYGAANLNSTGDAPVFYISPTFQFGILPDAYVRLGSVMLASDNYLYVVHDWINLFKGGIYRIPASGANESSFAGIIKRFGGTADGRNPEAALLELSDGYLYGTAPKGGTDESTNNQSGVLYRLKTNGDDFKVIHHFSALTGRNPNASVIDGGDGYIYGMAPNGGANNGGTIYKVKPDGSEFIKMYDFNSAAGMHPQGSLMLYNGWLYGMTSEGGNFSKGVVFKINVTNFTYTKLIDFTGSNGAAPLGGLVHGLGETLYGMTSSGGDNNLGTIFSLQTNGANLQTLFHFTTASGSAPNGNLIFMQDTFVSSPENATASAATTEAVMSTHRVYPNPFVESFTAEDFGNTKSDMTILLTDLNGQVRDSRTIKSGGSTALGSSLSKGIYILKVIQGDNVTIHRLVKN